MKNHEHPRETTGGAEQATEPSHGPAENPWTRKFILVKVFNDGRRVITDQFDHVPEKLFKWGKIEVSTMARERRIREQKAK